MRGKSSTLPLPRPLPAAREPADEERAATPQAPSAPLRGRHRPMPCYLRWWMAWRRWR